MAPFDADPPFMAPGDMPARILERCAEAYTVKIAQLASITRLHIVDGGSQNTLPCQLAADRAGRR